MRLSFSYFPLLLWFTCTFFACTSNADDAQLSKPITRIAFGSCNKHDKPQPLWAPILEFKPEVWIWLGDVVYADTRWAMFDWRPSTLEVMKGKFDAQKAKPEYQRLVKESAVVGVWVSTCVCFATAMCFLLLACVRHYPC